MPETIAQALGAENGLAEHIGKREMLLVLDNLEQVVAFAPDLSSLLERCPSLHLLVTSRELLRVRGEVEHPVPPLAESDAVELFSERSRLEPDETMAELCRRLDNLPLAIELAAARTGVLSPQQILDRLSEHLDLLKGGRDAEARQRTLRATIEWSYDLLSPEEQQLFARLSVFSGGCTLKAAEAVCEADVDSMQSLVEKSMLLQTAERFRMLETLREFAAERLEESGDADGRRRLHAVFFIDLAQSLGMTYESIEIHGGQRHDIVVLEQGNLRGADRLGNRAGSGNCGQAGRVARGLLGRGKPTRGRAAIRSAARARSGHARRTSRELLAMSRKLDSVQWADRGQHRGKREEPCPLSACR